MQNKIINRFYDGASEFQGCNMFAIISYISAPMRIPMLVEIVNFELEPWKRMKGVLNVEKPCSLKVVEHEILEHGIL